MSRRASIERQRSPEPGTQSLKGKPIKLHPRPRSGNSGSSREAAVECSHRPSQQTCCVLADRKQESRPAVSLNTARDPYHDRSVLHSGARHQNQSLARPGTRLYSKAKGHHRQPTCGFTCRTRSDTQYSRLRCPSSGHSSRASPTQTSHPSKP
jgi:hypothetical protein